MKSYTEKELKKWYDKYAEKKYFYRGFSKEYLKDMKKNGINPKKSPYQSVKTDLNKFFKILPDLE